MLNELQAPEDAVHDALTGTEKPFILFVLGAVDVGKTYTVTALANRFYEQQLRVAVVDADVGQSDIGPPCCIGMGLVEWTLHRLSDVPLRGLYFVGDTTPSRCTSECVQGTVAAVRKATALGAEVVIVDSTGWVEGEAAMAFKLQEIAAIHQVLVLAIEREDELDRILMRLTYPVLRVCSSEHVRTRTREERRALREHVYTAYFETARSRVFELRVFAWPPVEGRIAGLYRTGDTSSDSTEVCGLGIVTTLDLDRGTAVVVTPVPVENPDGELMEIGLIKPGAVKLVNVQGRWKELRSDRLFCCP
ncbi:MAG: Clp1/GlmU family protein [Candidatus Methanospirareceae archaeon]